MTVGIGHLIPDADAAAVLPFVERGTNISPETGEIEKAFDAVEGARHLTGSPATEFMSLTTLELSNTKIEDLMKVDVDEFLRQLKSRNNFPDYETYPPTAKLGLLDMAYNKGVRGLLKPLKEGGFPEFTAAVRRRDWMVAAHQSNRPQLDPKRNDQVRDWFLRAGLDEPFFLRPPCKKTLQEVLK